MKNGRPIEFLFDSFSRYAIALLICATLELSTFIIYKVVNIFSILLTNFFTLVSCQDCLAAGKLETAASYLIILQNLEQPTVSKQVCVIKRERQTPMGRAECPYYTGVYKQRLDYAVKALLTVRRW